MSKHDIQVFTFKESDFPILDELSQNYLEDISKFADTLKPDSSGRYDNEYFKTFFTEENLIPIAFQVDGNIIGFLMLIKGKTIDNVMNDFYISPDYRRKNIGADVMKQVFASHSGTYGFYVLEKNEPALNFWRAVFKRNGFTVKETAMIDDGEKVIKMIATP